MAIAAIGTKIESLRKEIIRTYGVEYWRDAKSLVSPSDWGSDDDSSWWVELDGSCPGDLEPYPHLVFCVQSYERGCIPARTYKPIA